MSELGTLLVRSREARGLTLEDAERDTRISRRYLQALETEQFEAIPAPVYARGFLRSYSQYLGLDPQEMLALFPRDEDEIGAAQQSTYIGSNRPVRQQPPSAVGPARPTWRGPQQQQQQRSQPQQQRQRRGELPLEPMIGVNIGVPTPARRINTDPAAQARSMTIAVVAIGAVIAVVLLALLISNLGGSSTAPGGAPANTTRLSTSGLQTQAAAAPTPAGALLPSGVPTTPGVVPNVIGLTAEKARAAISEAGLKFEEKTAKSTEAKGKVVDQSPAADSQVGAGFLVRIIVSEGP